ncbi:hydroxyisourate hydrolase [Halobacillus seohaensis]|uniref:5-hydroxyisourate hydrolase n=1 Tax=Halobacillus seohaensis TaxID=447421 RepID=A0ABW2EQN8_9BACI
MMGLTTHILDLTHGQPASAVLIELYSFEGLSKTFINKTKTNDDGRLDEPLLTSEALKAGEYELLFYIGDYFRAKELDLPDPMFLNKVSVRFGVEDTDEHYHVPLLISPWGYQVYRGS